MMFPTFPRNRSAQLVIITILSLCASPAIGQNTPPFITSHRLQVDASQFKVRSAELVVQKGHAEPLSGLCFTKDNRFLVSAGADQAITVWDLSTGKIFRKLYGNVTAIDVGQDSRTLAVASYEPNLVLVMDLVTGEELARLEGHTDAITAIAVHPDGKRIVSAGRDKTVRVWDFRQKKLLATMTGHQFEIESLALSKDGKSAFTGGGRKAPIVVQEWGKPKKPVPSNDHELKQWSLETYTFKKDLVGHDDIVNDLAVSPDGMWLAAGLYNGKAMMFNMAIGLPLAKYDFPGGNRLGGINAMAFQPDGSSLYLGSKGSAVMQVDPKSGKELGKIELREGILTVNHLAVSPDGKSLASAYSYRPYPELWELAGQRRLRVFEGEAAVFPGDLAVDPTGRFAAITYNDGSVKVFDLTLGRFAKVFFRDPPAGEYKDRRQFQSVTFTPDGKFLACTVQGEFQKGGGVGYYLYDMDSGTLVQPAAFGGRSGLDRTNAMAFSRDGKLAAYAVVTIADLNSNVEVFDMSGGPGGHVLEGHFKSVYDVQFSPDSRLLATLGKKEIKLWDLTTGQLKKEIIVNNDFDDYGFSLAFSPDGKRLAASGVSVSTEDVVPWLKIFDPITGTTLADLSDDKFQYSDVVFSPDGKFLVAVAGRYSRKFTIDVFDNTGKKVNSIRAHDYNITSVDFTPDGTTLLTSSNDGTVRMWDFKSGNLLATLVASGEQGLIVSTPANYYFASKDATGSVAFRTNERVFPFEQFDLLFNRPDLVLKSIGYTPVEITDAYERAYNKRLSKMGFSQKVLSSDLELPEIQIEDRTIPLTTREKNLTINITASDKKTKLDRINVFINDVPVYGSAGIDLRPLNQLKTRKALSVELSSGRNKIQLSVHNQQGIESLRETFEISYDGPSSKPSLYVLAIGVSEYSDAAYNLTYAAKDASDLSNTLKNASSYDRIFVKTILNKDATKRNILASREFLMQSKVDDEVIVFVAGHGLLDDKLDYYLATTDVEFNNPSANGLPYEDLEGLVDGIPARKKLILMDACHSGEVDKEDTELIATTQSSGSVKSRGFKKAQKKTTLGLKNSFELMKELFADLRRGSGAMVISSASGVEFAFESPEWKNGVFTYSLLEGLRTQSADKNKDGQVIVSELRDYVIEKVRTLTGGKQTPTSRQENLEFDFRVY